MKKQTLLKSTLCLLMALVCNVSWAQTFVAPEIGKFYKIKGDNTQYPWLTGTLRGSSIVVSANEEDAAVFEKTANGLKVLATGKYLGLNGSTVSLVDSEGTVTIDAKGNTEGKYSIKVGNTYMYNNKTDGITHESTEWLTIERFWGFIEVEVANTDVVDLTYTLTDNAGNTYEGTYQGIVGISLPTFTGVEYTLSSKAWDGNRFSATINFPFLPSNAETTNRVIISPYNNTNIKYFAVGDDVKSNNPSTATPLPSEIEKYLWAFYPTLTDGKFSFKIKSISTNKYIYSNPETSNHEAADVSLVEEANATSFTIIASNQNINEGGKYLSVSSSGTGEKIVGNYGTSHNGSKIIFVNANNYTLTDAAGNVFVGTNGVENLQSVFTYTNGTLTKDGYSANINFGFPTSAEGNEQEVFISPFNKGFKYYVSGTDVKATTTAPDANTIANYVWAIYPTLGENGFTFKIKHVGTGNYIYTTSTSNQHAQGVVTVEETATTFTLEASNAFKHSNAAYLSTNSTSSADQFAGTWKSTHNGTNNTIYLAKGENIYTLTDAVGNVYEGTYSGYVGISEPTFTGVEYTLTDKVWNGNQLTAKIEFSGLPFPLSPLSKPGEENWTFIRSYQMTDGKCYFHVDNDYTKVITRSPKADNGMTYLPTVDNIAKWQWAIYPAIEDGKIVFTIKNKAANKFVGGTGAVNPAPLADEGSKFGWGTCVGNGKGFSLVNNTNVFFAANSSGAGDQNAILWNKGNNNSHQGGNLEFFATSYTITTDASGYYALYTSAPTNAGVAAYSGKLNDDKTQLSLVRIIGTIPANTGVILKGEASTTYILTEATDNVEPIEGNDLTGSSESVTVSTIEGVAYTMQTTEGVTTFQKCTVDAIAGGQAYLVLPVGSEDRTITLQLPTDITYIVDKLNGPLYRDNATNQNWNKVWKSTQEPQLQLICDTYNMRWAGDNLELMTGTSNSSTYTLTAPAGYVITEYSFTFANNGHDTGIELTMDDGAAYITSKNAKTISAEDLTMNTVSFTLKGSNGNGVVLTDFVVTVDKDVVSAPKISTAEKQYWYYITNAATNDGTAYCKGKVIYYDSQMGKLRFGDRNFNAAYIWSFWEGDNGKIAIKNYNNQYFGTAPSGTGNSTTFGVVSEPNYIYNINAAHDFFIINDGGTDLHAQNDNKVIVRWGAAAGNASLWRFNEVNMANVAAAVRSTRVQQGKVTTGIGNTDQPIVRSIIRVSGLEGNVTFQGVKGQFAGDNKADVTKVKAYFATNERELFVDPEQKMTWRDENGVQFGTEVELAEDGTFTITGEKTLEVGEHYLWITYDIAETAKEGNTVDASITSYTIDGNEVAEDNGNPQHSVTIFLSEGAVLMPMDKGSLYYRIPAITMVEKNGKTRLVTLTDDRKNHNTDLPSHCYLVAQYSDDLGKTWSDPLTVAGTEATGGNYGHGDASIVTDRNTGNIIGIMTSCGTYGHGFFGGTAEQPPLWKTITSTDGGETWSVPVDHTASLFGAACDNEKTKTWKSGFSGSGAALQKRDGTLVSSFVNREADNSQHFYFFMSKDGGENWYVSGTSGTAGADEPKTLERNNGDLAISVRASGYNYYNYTSDNGATWHNASQTRFNTGISGNACDGEYMVWCSTKEGNFDDIAFQTLPNSGSRENVSIALSLDEGATFLSPKTICPIGSAYSAAVVLPDGTLGVYYEENGVYGGFTMRFVRFSMDWASDGAYKFPEDNPYKPIAAVAPASVTSSINEYKMGTFYANDPVNIPNGVKAYAAIEEPTMENGAGVITMTRIEDVIPAHTGVVICAGEGAYTFEQASTNGVVVNGNMMRGYAGNAEYKEVTLSNDYTTYVLTVKNDEAGFYRKDADFKVYNNKAYLQVPTPPAEDPAGANIQRYLIRFAGTTEIESSVLNAQGSAFFFDLQGRPVENPTKGIYIVNGKKVVIK